MNYIQTFIKKFNKVPNEEQIGILMQALAMEEKNNLSNKGKGEEYKYRIALQEYKRAKTERIEENIKINSKIGFTLKETSKIMSLNPTSLRRIANKNQITFKKKSENVMEKINWFALAKLINVSSDAVWTWSDEDKKWAVTQAIELLNSSEVAYVKDKKLSNNCTEW
tara:strand:- start:16845 stop:17345 length:501 start_codon:yes stop_codon:yes gene_type:complete